MQYLPAPPAGWWRGFSAADQLTAQSDPAPRPGGTSIWTEMAPAGPASPARTWPSRTGPWKTRPRLPSPSGPCFCSGISLTPWTALRAGGPLFPAEECGQELRRGEAGAGPGEAVDRPPTPQMHVPVCAPGHTHTHSHTAGWCEPTKRGVRAQLHETRAAWSS